MAKFLVGLALALVAGPALAQDQSSSPSHPAKHVVARTKATQTPPPPAEKKVWFEEMIDTLLTPPSDVPPPPQPKVK